MSEAFLYVWKNIVSGKQYVGVHKGDPGDGYIASSKTFLEDYAVAPYLFERTILEEGLYQDMLNEEARILIRDDAKNNPEYYNMHNGDGKFYNKGHTEETKRKMRARSPWNKNLSKDTHPSIAKHAQSMIGNDRGYKKGDKPIAGWKNGHKPWSAGLSVSTDEKFAAAMKKAAQTRTGQTRGPYKGRAEYGEKWKRKICP